LHAVEVLENQFLSFVQDFVQQLSIGPFVDSALAEVLLHLPDALSVLFKSLPELGDLGGLSLNTEAADILGGLEFLVLAQEVAEGNLDLQPSVFGLLAMLDELGWLEVAAEFAAHLVSELPVLNQQHPLLDVLQVCQELFILLLKNVHLFIKLGLLLVNLLLEPALVVHHVPALTDDLSLFL